MIETDIAVIGAGPAGLMASIYAAHKSAKAVIIDTNTTPGLKLLRTGGGRCNITHSLPINEFIKVYGDSSKFLRFALHDFGPDKTIEFFEKNALKIQTDEHGFCYPYTNRASDVKRVLTDIAESFKVKFQMASKIEHIEREKRLFILQAPKEVILAKAVIIATGGMSWPQTGSNGDGYKFAKTLGHTIVNPKPALVPLKTADTWMHKLTGVAIDRVAIRAEFEDKKFTTVGPMIFTDNGIGGPAVLDFSRYITDYLAAGKPAMIKLDLIPDRTLDQIDNNLTDLCRMHPKKEIPGILSEFMPRKLALSICENFDYLKATLSGQLNKQNRRKLAGMLKGLEVKVIAPRSMNEATITRGGVSTAEIDDKTMQSKICPGLFFAGEVIDVDGPCGGFNLQICWSTGVLAGTNAQKYTTALK